MGCLMISRYESDFYSFSLIAHLAILATMGYNWDFGNNLASGDIFASCTQLSNRLSGRWWFI